MMRVHSTANRPAGQYTTERFRKALTATGISMSVITNGFAYDIFLFNQKVLI